VERIFEAIEKHKPQRIVIDSLSEIRLLAQNSLRYRRQILALKHYFARNKSTVITLDDLTTESTDRAVHSIAHSVIHLVTAPSAGGFASQNAGARAFAAAITISSSPTEAYRHFRDWWPPSTGTATRDRRSGAALPNWMRCSAAASPPGRAL
jgi:hypothetical protein